MHRVVRRALAVDRDRVEARVDRGPQELDRLARLERVVGRDDREHRRELRVDHPGALRHAADREARPPRGDRLLRVRVRRHDRLGRVVAAVPRERRGGPHAGDHVRERERRADHAGREDEHLLVVEAEQPRRLGGGRAGVELARARRSRHSRRPEFATTACGSRELEMLLADDDGRGEHAVRREHRRRPSRARASGRPTSRAAPSCGSRSGRRSRRSPWRR